MHTDTIHIGADSYYHPKASYPPNTVVNFDVPDAIDHHHLAEHLRQLKAGESVDIPIYDYTTHNRKTETVRISPAHIIIVDGIFVLGIKKIRELADFSIFVSASNETCLARRLARNTHRKARSDAEDIAYFARCVEPSITKYIDPSRMFADSVIENNGDYITELTARVTAAMTPFGIL